MIWDLMFFISGNKKDMQIKSTHNFCAFLSDLISGGNLLLRDISLFRIVSIIKQSCIICHEILKAKIKGCTK